MIRALRRDFTAWVLTAGTALYLAGSIAFALTKAPSNDEGWFAAPAYNLAKNGLSGTPSLEPTGSWLDADLTGIHEHTYWIMPLGMVTQGAWFRIVGFGLRQMRALSILSGLIVLGAWFSIIRSLTGDRVTACLGFVLLALDYTFLWGAADGRVDMMCVALGSVGIAAYLVWRESNLTAAILISQTFAAAGLFTHPNGLMAMMAVGLLTLYYDAGKLRVKHLVGVLPYIAGLLGWGLYISLAPAQFLAQFAANASLHSGSRWSILTNPLRTLYYELLHRYVAHFGFMPVWTDSTSRWNSLIPAIYWGSLVSAASSGIRKCAGNRMLIAIAMVYFVMLTANGLKLQMYLVYVMPVYAAIFALWARYMAQRPAIVFVPVLLGPLLYLQVSSIIQLVHADQYHASYLPAMEYVKRNAGPDSVIFGNSTAAFILGYDHLVDDERLGYFSSVQPDYLIADRYYPVFWSGFRRDQPEVARSINAEVQSEYQPVFKSGYYKIYQHHAYRPKMVSSLDGIAARILNRNRRAPGCGE